MSDWLKDHLVYFAEGERSYKRPKGLDDDQYWLWQRFHFATRLNLEAGAYFCRQVLGAAKVPDELGFPGLAWRQLKWYLDAFFFELVSAHDTLLQELNLVYGPRLAIDKVRWWKIKRKQPKKLRQHIDRNLQTDWFGRVVWYRNTAAHRMYVPTDTMRAGSGEGEHPWEYDMHKVNLWYRDGDQRWQWEEIQACEDYLKKVIKHVCEAWSIMESDFEDQGKGS